MLQVDDLDRATNITHAMRESVTPTNVFVRTAVVDAMTERMHDQREVLLGTR
jgi:hypothetical protein